MALPTNPMGGFTTGQLVGELIQDQKGQDSKTKRRRNLAMGVSLLLGGGDAMLRNKHQNVINKLDESKVTDIAKNSKMFDDATELQTVQESIDSYGGGLTGALAHYDANAELAFNTTHRNLVDEFDKTQSGKKAKQTWKESFVRDNLYKKHQLKYNEADASKISGLSREEFNKPINEYYTAKIDQANNPANKSMIHKGFQKGAEILGFRTKEDTLTDKVLEEEIDYNTRNNKINQYRTLFTNNKVQAPAIYTKNSIEGLSMTKQEFFDAWNNDVNLDKNYAEYAFQEFNKTGQTLKDYQTQAISYLAKRSDKDTEVLKDQARNKVMALPDYKDLSVEEQKLRKNVAVITALGGDGRNMQLQADTMALVNELIETEADGYELIQDDPKTPNINEAVTKELLFSKTWAEVKSEQLRKLTGAIDIKQEQAKFVTQSKVLLYNDIKDRDTRIVESIKTIQIPTGATAASNEFGEGKISRIIESKFADTKNANNSQRRESITTKLVEANYNLSNLSEGDEAYNILYQAQEDYYVIQQNQNIVEMSHVYADSLRQINKPIQ